MSNKNKLSGITGILPEYPPISPSQASSISTNKEDFNTPNNSPPSSAVTPVIVSNPFSFLSAEQNLELNLPKLNDPHEFGSKLTKSCGKWDNSFNTPSYQKSDREFWTSRQLPIPIRSTLSSAFSGLSFTPTSSVNSEAFEVPLNEIMPDNDNTVIAKQPTVPETLAAEVTRLSGLKERLLYKISRIKPEKVTVSQIASSKQKLNDVLNLSEEYGLGMTILLKNTTLDLSARTAFTAELESVHSSVDNLEEAFWDKVQQLEAVVNLNSTTLGSQATDENTENESGDAYSRNHTVSASTSLSRIARSGVSAANVAVIAKASVKYKALIDLALSTTQDIEEEGLYLETFSNEKVQRLIMKISKYEKSKEKIKSLHNEYLEFTASDKPDAADYDPKKLETAVNNSIQAIDHLIAALEEEDISRELCTLLPKKTEKVKWPTFAGKPGESLIKFKENFLKAARQNQTNKEDQFTKLRENLKDFALTLVPEHMNDVDAAFKRLHDTYGDPQKLINFELKKLEKIDSFPNCDDGSFTMGTRAQAEWLLQVETILSELSKMAIAEDADLDLKRSVYGPQTTSMLLSKFPLVLKQKLISAAKSDPATEKLDAFILKLGEWSAEALEMEKYHVEAKIIKKSNQPSSQIIRNPQVQLFNPPKPLPTCLVCVELQKKQRVSPQLLHISAHVTGCPMFVEMNIFTRTSMCNSLKLCKMCLREDTSGHDKSCMVLKLKNKNKAKKKYEFTCKDTYCYRHMWLCSKHKGQNQESMDAKATQLDKDHGLKLIYLLGENKFGKTPEKVETGPVADSNMKGISPDINNSNSQRPPTDSRVFRQVEKKLRKKVRKSCDSPVEIVPVPEGTPMFMFQALRGKSKPVFAFYDNGCSNACIRSGIPGDQLRGQILAKGPFTVEGVNGVLIEAGDEWLIHLDRIDGRKQALRGLTLDQITATSPQFNIEEATLAVKSDKPSDTTLQSCSLPKIVGGTVDLLIGIQYNSIFPQPVHRLPNGLEICRCVLASHDGSINATIRGPHSSFQALANEYGGAASVMALFVAGLEKFKKWGPPSIKSFPMSSDDILHAKTMNYFDSSNPYSGELLQVEAAEELLEEIWDSKETTPETILLDRAAAAKNSSAAVKPLLVVCECNTLCPTLNNLSEGQKKAYFHNNGAYSSNFDECGKISVKSSHFNSSSTNYDDTGIYPSDLNNRGLYSSNFSSQGEYSANFADIEKISPLCKLKLLDGEGLSVEYRCVKCRDCPDCKNSDETEKTSLREEAEEQMIRDSVKLDLENRRIICSLPVRGAEKDFLTTNRDRAVKVLDQQCRKYHADKEVTEIASKAFLKLLDNGHAAFIQDVDPKFLDLFMHKDPQYFIPWRLVFKDSVTTPCRAVLDASSRTNRRPDGTAGRCLNDLVVKGKVTTINLVKMLLRFTTGRYALNGDLKQFYNSCKLHPNQWNLQRFVYRANMDPNNPIQDGVIQTLIYGVKSVSRQSEYAISLLANHVREDMPAVAKLLEESRYVDDEGESKSTKEECYQLIEDANKAFSLVNLQIKEWLVSGEKPTENVSKDGASVDVGGMKWFPVMGTMEVKIPLLHFAKKNRGRLSDTVKMFDCTGLSTDQAFNMLDEFVPKKLTRRMVASKKASIFDILGKLSVLLIRSSVLLRLTMKMTSSWDDEMPPDLRHKWLHEFLLWEQLRGLQFSRAVMPDDALDSKLRVIVSVDAASQAITLGAWGGFLKSNGTYSCQLMIGRSLLAPEDSTIPKSELTSFMGGSNLLGLIRNTLKDWLDDYILIGDSAITLCWVSSENKKLSQFVRNRVIQVRRMTDLDRMYHVISAQNPADVGTRPELVTLNDVQSGSKWISGMDWMKGKIETAVNGGILTPVRDLRLTTNEEVDSFHDGCVFDQVPEILTRGHVLNERRISLIQERASFSKYLLLPTKFSFRRTIRIYSYVFSFVHKLKVAVQTKKGISSSSSPFEGSTTFSIFTVSESSVPSVKGQSHYEYFSEFTAAQSPPGYYALSMQEKNASAALNSISDKFINMALTYLYRKTSAELKKFNSAATVEKMAIEQDNILLSKSRILDTMNFVELGDLGLGDIPVIGLKGHIPVIDRHSPVAYMIAQHIHWNVSHHRGVETCNRFSLQHCHILQGLGLFKEIAQECLWCAKKRKKLIEASMGPISDHQIAITPPFWCAQIDIFGPISCYVPGYQKSTRNRPVATVKTWVLTSVCVVTKLVNCQVLEQTDASGILDGITRLACEVGLPSIMLADQGSNLMKALREAQVTLVNLKLQIYEEKGIKFEVCSVGGHSEHGLVERSIRSIQESFDECGLRNQVLSATGLQTLAKLVENDYNNLPLGFKYARDQNNTEILKILTPNMMRMGRSNNRALSGPLKLPNNSSDMVERVLRMYRAWYSIWSDVYVPKLLFQPKWYKHDVDLKKGDLVYFQKSDSIPGSNWILGMISDLHISRDGKIRKVEISYRNSNEMFDRTTLRNIRTVCKIWSEDDFNLQDDLFELANKLKGLDSCENLIANVFSGKVTVPSGRYSSQILAAMSDSARPALRCCDAVKMNVFHNPSKPMRVYKAVADIPHSSCQLVPEVPVFKAVVDTMLEPPPDAEDLGMDTFSAFLFNWRMPC